MSRGNTHPKPTTRGFTHRYRTLQEAETRTIDLPEDDPALVERLIDFAYTGTYDPYSSGASTAAENEREFDHKFRKNVA